MKIEGTSALVTGAGLRLGAANAVELARCGAKITRLDLKLEAAQQVARDIVAAGG